MKDRQSQSALYRLYDTDRKLLYIGASCDLRARFSQHASTQTWWPQVANWESEWFSTRKEALAAEREAIMRERPRYNKKNTFAPRREPSRVRVLKGKVANMAREIAKLNGQQWARKYKVASGLHFLNLGEVSEEERRRAREERLPAIRGAYDLLAEVSEYLSSTNEETMAGVTGIDLGEIVAEHDPDNE